MTFLHAGLAAAAAACVAIPILIHLLMRRRRKPVMWGAMRFLQEAYRRQRKRLMLEQWLLLATRCLLVLLLGLAIARPLLGGLGQTAGGRTVYLLIDNGLASTAGGGGSVAAGRADSGSALARHKAAADRILAQLATGAGSEVGDRVALITMGGPSEGIVVPPSGDIDAVRRLAAGIAPTDSRTDINGAVALAASAIQSESERDGGAAARGLRRPIVVLLSDFLDGSAELDSALTRLPDGVTLLASRPLDPAASAALDNTSITAVEPLRPLVISGTGEGAAGAGEQVRVTLRRSGAGVAQPGATTVRLRVTRPGEDPTALGAGSTARGVVRFEPGQEEAATVVPITISAAAGGTTGGDAGLVVLEAETDADAVPADNRWRRPIEVRQALRVGVVALRRFGDLGRADQLTPAEWLRLALRPTAAPGALDDTGAIEVHEVEPAALDPGRLARLDALILPRPDLLNADMWRRVRGFVDSGGLVVVTPPADATVHIWADAMISELNLPWTLPREAAVFGRAGVDGENGQGARLSAPTAAMPSSTEDLLALLRPELEDLTRPVAVFRALPIQFDDAAAGAASSQRLLTLGDGGTLLWAGELTDRDAPEGAAQSPGRGLVVYLGVPFDLNWTDLPARPLMVPLVQELVRQGIGRARGSWWGLAGRSVPVPHRSVELLKVQDRAAPSGSDSAGPTLARVDTATGLTADPIRHAGIWRAADDRGGSRGVVAVNADPRGGLVTPQPATDVQRWLRTAAGDEVLWLDAGAAAPASPGSPDAANGAALAAALAGDDQGPPISFPLLLIAAVLVVFELALARFASHADTGGGGGGGGGAGAAVPAGGAA